MNGNRQGSLFPDFADDEVICSHLTAMHRTGPSSIARALIEGGFLQAGSTQRVLDFGCGHGADVAYYRAQRLAADGYDPHTPYGWHDPPTGQYDIVTLVFVLNVVPKLEQRVDILRDVYHLLGSGGKVAVATRSSEAIAREVAKKNWQPFGDGYLSDPRKRTFQRGMDRSEIEAYLQEAGFRVLQLDCVVGGDVALAFGDTGQV